MKTKLEACISVCVYILLSGYAAASAIGSSSANDVSTRSVSSRNKNKVDMMRFTRTLHMLRLGKRDLMGSLSMTRDVPMLRLGRPSAEDDRPASLQETKQQLRAILAEFLESQAVRDETRRQPPLPRYGRRSVPLNRRNLRAHGSGSHNSIFPFQLTAEEDPVYRNAPRGGRFKRSVAGAPAQGYRGDIVALYLSPYESQRISHYLQEKQHDMQEKAVPYPRIGRDQTSGLPSNKQMVNQLAAH